MPSVRGRDLSKSFGALRVLGNFSFEAEEGAILCLFGPSGCGKTTLLRLVAGLERPDAGAVYLGDRVVSEPGRVLSPVERSVGMVFQDFALWPHMRVEKHLDFVLKASGMSKPERASRADFLLGLVNLDNRRDAKPHDLSGGERQRVAIARALATDPDILLLDEPFSNLDGELRKRVAEHIQSLKAKGKTILLATHDTAEVERLADKVVRMDGDPKAQ
jgi:iron(III) transport system ATP-binding protein